MQQLEIEAAQMQITVPQASHNTPAHSTRGDSQSLGSPVTMQLHPSTSYDGPTFVSLPARLGSAADTRISRRQSLPQDARGRGIEPHNNPLRRTSSHGMDGVHEHGYHSQEGREQLGRSPSNLRHSSASANSEAEADSSLAASRGLPRMRRRRQPPKPSQPSGITPGVRTPVRMPHPLPTLLCVA